MCGLLGSLQEGRGMLKSTLKGPCNLLSSGEGDGGLTKQLPSMLLPSWRTFIVVGGLQEGRDMVRSALMIPHCHQKKATGAFQNSFPPCFFLHGGHPLSFQEGRDIARGALEAPATFLHWEKVKGACQNSSLPWLFPPAGCPLWWAAPRK